jgi:DnaK suppressor protein
MAARGKIKTSRKPAASAKKAVSSKKTPTQKKVTARGKASVKPKGTKPQKTAVRKSLPARKTAPRETVSKKKIREPKKKVEKAGGKKSDRLPELKKTLLRRREAIVREAKEEIAKYVSGENRQLVDTALDEGDWAVVDISEDINLMRLGAHRKALHDIDEALRKINEGTYGICEECGEEISEKRLSVIPTATLCVNCQGNKEQIEAIQKQEEV